MRLLAVLVLSLGLFACESPASSGATSDTGLDDATGDATTGGDGGAMTDDAASSDSSNGDSSGSDSSESDSAGSDSTGGDDASTTDTAPGDSTSGTSPWIGKLFVNEVHAGGSKTPTAATDADWFELYNAGATDITLTGCTCGGLTNGFAGSNPIPGTPVVPAGGFLVIYYNHDNLGAPVIDAGIKSDGSMALWDSSGAMIDSVDWDEGASPAGSSYDRVPDGGATWKTSSPPTPGAANSK